MSQAKQQATTYVKYLERIGQLRRRSPTPPVSEPDSNISVDSPRPSPSPIRSRSQSLSQSPPHDGVVLNLDTKATKVPTASDDEERTAFGKPSPKPKEPNGFKSRLEETFRQEHAADSGPSRKSKNNTEVQPDHPEPEENGYRNGVLEAHHHAVRSRKTAPKADSPLDYYVAPNEKPLSHVPKSNMEQLDLSKSLLPIPKYANPESSGLSSIPFSLTHPYRPEYAPYLLPHYPHGSESAFLAALQLHWGSPAPQLFLSLPDPSKDARPSSPPRTSPPKGAPFYPPRVDPSHPSQSSAVAPIH